LFFFIPAMSEDSLDAWSDFDTAGLEIRELGRKGRGVFTKKPFQCGDVVLRETGFHAKTMDKLTDLLVASEAGCHAARNMYAGPLHHLQRDGGADLDGEKSPEWIDMYAKVRFNCFDLDGSTLLPNMGMFNHSCQPNIAMVVLEPHADCKVAMVVIAKDGIASGQEAVQCYNSDVMFIPLEVRRQQLMASWNFLCTCDRCQAEEAQIDGRGDDEDEQHAERSCEQLVNLDEDNLNNLYIYFDRQDAMHQPGLEFKLRRQMFGAQLAATCAILPHLHPKLRDVYQQLEDLCEPSPFRDHCDRVCKFYDSLCKDGHCVWSVDTASP
jgi:hypothetical protein